MSRTLLIVHGMGVYKTGWEKEIVAALDAAAAVYPALCGHAFSTLVKTVPVTYDDVFARWTNEIGTTARAVADYAKSNRDKVDSSLSDLTDWLEQADSDQFAWTNISDVIAYRFFPDVRAEVQACVLEQITGAVSAAKIAAAASGEEATISAMAHSLGTSVLHDALEQLGTVVYRGTTGDDSQFLAKNGVLLSSLFMVANVGRVLATRWPVSGTDTCVRPIGSGADPYCGTYFSFRHTLDPIPAVCPFNPGDWGKGYLCIEDLSHIANLNVHGWTHYLADPSVHLRLFRALLANPDVITEELIRESVNAYNGTPSPVCSAVRDALPADLADVAHVAPPCTVGALVKSASAYFAVLAKAAAACGIDLAELPR